MRPGDFDIGADISVLSDLNERQRSYIPRFHAIMDEILQAVGSLNSNWSGDASEVFAAAGNDFAENFRNANLGFSKMVDASDGVVENYNKLHRDLGNIFG
ncbi:hypothetical protein J4H86_09270 [Spiractinospora alimapuensis]|uniref:WXG100 family type VII secretion target n=1 Tax=Spiractinospora alimapuensis TaxID=2820884 RepID=UPI001F2C7D39|nr:hypothetical protein [Spiractinospora alimapuensis]QVQ53877.1 hypothetical protein J4H86_09270 [Spiractinospora alimapuensis]